jgi:class 3 adenylate cyclase
MRNPSYCRMDFVQEVISMDEATRIVRFKVKPDPRRYEIIDRDGIRCYRDKYLDDILPENVLREAFLKSAGIPVYSDPPTIGNALEYAANRRDAVEAELKTGVFTPPESKADAHHTIHLDDSGRYLTFLSVDICGSTKLRVRDEEAFDRAYKIFVQELGTVVGQFHGTILTLTGDGFIAYLDHPSINTQCDNAIDMGLTFIAILETGINPALELAKLPTISIHVGADHGIAIQAAYNIPTTGFSDLSVRSDALNRCVKIQGEAGDNQLLIGRELYERLHVQWLERCVEQKIKIAKKLGFDEYPVYSVK